MQFCVDTNTSLYQIRRFEANTIWINDESYTQSLIVMPQALINNWRPRSFEDLHLADLEPLLAHNLELILIGSGVETSSSHFASPELVAFFASRKIGLEVMSTSAAARTYTILSSEERRVAAALIL
jgi:uncharacterized protein